MTRADSQNDPQKRARTGSLPTKAFLISARHADLDLIKPGRAGTARRRVRRFHEGAAVPGPDEAKSLEDTTFIASTACSRSTRSAAIGRQGSRPMAFTP